MLTVMQSEDNFRKRRICNVEMFVYVDVDEVICFCLLFGRR